MKLGRRGLLLNLLWLLPAAFLARFLTPKGAEKSGVQVSLDRVPFNGAYLIRDKQIGVINAEGQVRAVSIACTHLGCTLNVDGDRFICPCHGSVFDLKGKVLKGPAVKDLRELDFKIQGDTLEIYV